MRVQKDFEFPFPAITEHCPSTLFFNVGLGEDETFKMVVAYTNRDAHDKKPAAHPRRARDRQQLPFDRAVRGQRRLRANG